MDISCLLCGVGLQAHRTRAYPTEPFPQARWDGGYDGKDVSKEDIEWSNHFRALRKVARGPPQPLGGNWTYDMPDAANEIPFVSGIGSLASRAFNGAPHHSRNITAPVNPARHVDDPGYQATPEDQFSLHSPYPLFGDEQGQGFVFHSRCWEIFRRMLPKRVRDETTGERAYFVDSEVREKMWDIMSSSDRLSGGHRGWEAGVGQHGFEGAESFQWSRYGGRRTAWANNRRGASSHGGAKNGRQALAYFVADPMSIARLTALLDAAPRVGDVEYPVTTFEATTENPSLPDIFARLPTEILDMVLCMLPSRDVCNLRLAARSLAEEPLSNTFFRSRFRNPHELSYVWEAETIPRSAAGKVDWRALYEAVKALTRGPEDDKETEDADGDSSDDEHDWSWVNFCTKTTSSTTDPIRYARNPIAPGLANRLRITRLMRALVNWISLMIDTPLKGDVHRGRISMLQDELQSIPAENPEDDDLSPQVRTAEDFPDRCIGTHFLFVHRVELVNGPGSASAANSASAMGLPGSIHNPIILNGVPGTFGAPPPNQQQYQDFFDFYPVRGRSRVRIRKTISAGPQKIFGRDLEEQFVSRPRSSSDARCKETGGRRCIWGKDKVVTKIGVSVTGKAEGTPKYEYKSNGDCADGLFICGLSFWGKNRRSFTLNLKGDDVVMDDEKTSTPLELLGEVGYIHDYNYDNADQRIVEFPEGCHLIGIMVGASEAGIRRIKPLTSPPWYKAPWIGSAAPYTIYKQAGFNEKDIGDMRTLNKPFIERRALGFEPCRGGSHSISRFGEEWPAAEGRILVEDGWTIGGMVVGVGLLRLTSIALVEHRLHKTPSYTGKGKAKATSVDIEGAVMVDGERVISQPLPLGPKDTIIPPEGHIDGLPSFIDRYLWLPRFPVPDYEELNPNAVTFSPRNFMQAEKSFYHDALLSAGHPILPLPPGTGPSVNAPYYPMGPGLNPPPPPISPVKTKDEFSAMTYIDFGGPGGKDLKRLIGINAWYGSRIVHARGVLALEFIYEMDETDIKAMPSHKTGRRMLHCYDTDPGEERWIEQKEWGNCWSGIRLGGAIDGPGGERIIRIGGESFDVYGRFYIGIWFITNFGRKLSFPACPTPAQPARPPRKRRKAGRRVFPVPLPATVQVIPGSSALQTNSWPAWGAQGQVPALPGFFSMPPPPPPPPPPGTTQLDNGVLVSSPSEDEIASGTVKVTETSVGAMETIDENPRDLMDISTEIDTEEARAGLIKTNGDSTHNEETNSDATISEELPMDAPDGTEEPAEKAQTEVDDAAAKSPTVTTPPPHPTVLLNDAWDADWMSNQYSSPTPDFTKDSLGFRYFDPEDEKSIITGLYSVPGVGGHQLRGQGLRDFFEGFGVVAQKPSVDESETFELRSKAKADLGELEEGCPQINFTVADKESYLLGNPNANSFVRDFIGEVDLDAEIARIRIYFDPYNFNAGASSTLSFGGSGKITGLLFEYPKDDLSQLVSDGNGGLRKRSSKILGEWRETEYAGTFELEPGERIDCIWVWHSGKIRRRQRNAKDYESGTAILESQTLKDLHAGKEMWGVSWPKGIRFRTTSGRMSRVYGEDKEQKCKIFQSLPNKTLVGLKWGYETYDEWLSPVFRELDNAVPPPGGAMVAENIWPIPIAHAPYCKNDAFCQLLADPTDEEFSAQNLHIIRGYFDVQFNGIEFVYISGATRRYGDRSGVISEFKVLEGERVFSLKYRPGNRFALCLGVVRFDEDGEPHCRSTPLFGTELPGFGLPPIEGDVTDSLLNKTFYDDEERLNDLNNESSEYSEDDDVSEYDEYPDDRVAYEAHVRKRSVQKAARGASHYVGPITSSDGFIEVRVPNGMMFAGIWSRISRRHHRIGLLVRDVTDTDDHRFSTVNSRELQLPSPPSPFLPVTDYGVDADDITASTLKFSGRPYAKPLPWLGLDPFHHLDQDLYKISRKIGGQVGSVRLFTMIPEPAPVDVVCYYSFPTRMAHIHNLELLPVKGTSVQFGPPAYLGSLAKKKTIHKNPGMAIGMRIGMANGVYPRAEYGDPEIAGWPIKVYRCKGGEPHIVTIELLFHKGKTSMLTPQPRESTYKSKCPPRLRYETIMCEEGHGIVGFHGNFGLYLHAIGFISAPIKKEDESMENVSGSSSPEGSIGLVSPILYV